MATAGVLGLLFTTACNGKNDQKSNEFADEQVAPTTSAPAPDYAAGTESPRAMDRELSAPGDSSTRTARSSARNNNTARRNTAPAAREEHRTESTEVARPPVQPMTSLDHRQPNAAAPVSAPRVTWREVTIPAGTALPLELQTALSSETAKVENEVRARTRSAVVIDGYTAIPAGATVIGTVTDVERAGRVKGRSKLAFAFNEVQMDNGHEDLRTQTMTYEGDATKGEDATKVGAGAGIGAIIGGITGGKKGAGKGAVIGGAAGTGVVLATRGKEVELASGTDLSVPLASPLTVRVQVK